MKVVIIFLLLFFIIYNYQSKTENFTSQLPIYCINLEGADKRWNNVTSQFNDLGIEIKRFPAVNGKKLKNIDNTKILDTYNTNVNALCDKKIKPNLTLNLSKGEYGCALSHLGLWEKIVRENIDSCIIIEDDINPNQNFSDYQSLVSNLPSDWDIAYVSFLNTGSKKFLSDKIYVPTCGFTTAGYIINIKGAKKLIDLLPIEGPIDLYLLSLFRSKKINAYVLDGLCDSTGTWGGNDSSIEHSTRNINKFSAKKVLVIGNAPYEKENMGEEIDKYDIVVRFNNYPNKGYQEHIGTKTDIWCLSDATYTKNKPLVRERSHIKKKFIVTPDVYKDKLESINDNDFEKLLENRDIDVPKEFDFGKSWPSTGLLTLFYLMKKYDDITIFCFNGFDKTKKSIHFYENLQQWGHKSDKEKYVIEKLLNEEKIKRL
jgi:glycosyl transferase, family 25